MVFIIREGIITARFVRPCRPIKCCQGGCPYPATKNHKWFAVHLRQHRTIPALRLKHRSGGCGTASALPKCSIMSGCGTRIVLRGQKPLALCDRCPCFGSLFPPLAALTFAASSIICAFGLASAAPRSPYRHLELCGVAIIKPKIPARFSFQNHAGIFIVLCEAD